MLYMSKYQHGIQNIEVTYVPENSVGVLSSSDVISDILPQQNILFTLVLANNKSGALQHVSKVTACFRELQVLFHIDTTQAVG